MNSTKNIQSRSIPKKVILKSMWILCVVLAILVGLYAFSFLSPYANTGLQDQKPKELLASEIWNFGFYMHIVSAGVALTIGWVLFLKKFRARRIEMHRTIGKIYVITAILSGLSGLYIAYHATGGLIAKLGFSGMAIAWLTSTIIAYLSIRNKNIEKHKRWMIRSYAVAFTGVTFRLWMPILTMGFGLDFLDAYRIDSWLGWIPNLIFAQFLVSKR